jgi:hypothetical protein
MRPESERLEGLGHVAYEITMMIEATLHFSDIDQVPRGDGLAQNVYLESALLHARNLVEFLAGPDDTEAMHAGDFTPEWDPTQWSHLMKESAALGEHLSHLSWRQVRTKAGALSPDIFDRILAGCQAFEHRLTETNLGGETMVRAALAKAAILDTPRPASQKWNEAPPFSSTVVQLASSDLVPPETR